MKLMESLTFESVGLPQIQGKLDLEEPDLEEKLALEVRYPLTTQRYLLLADYSI